MTILELTPELLFKIAGDPAIYSVSPFLEPMKIAALTKAARYKGGCKNCEKRALAQDMKLVGAALIRLLSTQHVADPESVIPFKKMALTILRNTAEQLMVKYRVDGQERFLQF